MFKNYFIKILILILICVCLYLLYQIFFQYEKMQTKTQDSYSKGIYIPTYFSTKDGNAQWLGTRRAFEIYDVFYSPMNEIVIVMPMQKDIEHPVISINGGEPLEKHACIHHHSFVYVAKVMGPYEPNIDIRINSVLYKDIHVNKLPDYDGKIIMTTCVKNEDKYVKQWIRYNKSLGIQHFVFYDNAPKDVSTLANTLAEDIADGTVLLVQWPYTYDFAQFVQMNHSLYGFRNAKYIGYFDVDEYINPQCEYYDIDELLNHIMEKKSVSKDNICSIRFMNRFFYNPDDKSVDGFEFLKITNCGEIVYGMREKMFVLPRNTNMVSVHTVTDFKENMKQIDSDIVDVYFNHYAYLNKPDRGRDRTNHRDNSIHAKLEKFGIL